jgi:hypothetical protein
MKIDFDGGSAQLGKLSHAPGVIFKTDHSPC